MPWEQGGAIVGHFVPAPRCPPSVHGPELGDLGSWKRWKGRAVGMGDPAAGHFSRVRRCPGVVGRGGWPSKPRCSSQLPGARAGCPACVPSATCFWPQTASCILLPGNISGSEEEICPGGGGGGHYVKWLGLFQSGTDASLPPEPGEDTALAELLRQPYGTGQGVLCPPSPAPFCNWRRQDICLQGQNRAQRG